MEHRALYGEILRDKDSLEFVINNVFLPPKLPQKGEERQIVVREWVNILLTLLNTACADFIAEHVAPSEVSPQEKAIWDIVKEMLFVTRILHAGVSLNAIAVEDVLKSMKPGGVRVFYIQAQNAGLIIRQPNSATTGNVIFESFEASPANSAIMGSKKKLLCYFPGPSISLPLTTFRESNFITELAKFLAAMDQQELSRAEVQSKKAGGEVTETRDSNRPIYITQLLTALLRGLGGTITNPAGQKKITKRIADDVIWEKTLLPWRRCPPWLVMRVALQTTLPRSTDAFFPAYKAFLMFFMSKLVDVAVQHRISSDLLRVMSAKLSRRAFKSKGYGEDMYKIVPVVRAAVDNVRKELEWRWAEIQAENSAQMKQQWQPASLDFMRDTQLTMTESRKHIQSVLHRNLAGSRDSRRTSSNSGPSRIGYGKQPFSPGKLDTFIATANQEGARSPLMLVLADFELWVENFLESWTASNRTSAGSQELSQCIRNYTSTARTVYKDNPQKLSTMLLTTLELWIALDKVTVSLFEILEDYAPADELDLSVLRKLLLPQRRQMERLCTVEQYILTRKRNSFYGSILSDKAGRTTFSVRYVSTSSSHQQLLNTITEAAQRARNAKLQEINNTNRRYEDLMRQYREGECEKNYMGNHKRKCTKCGYRKQAQLLKVAIHEWPLPENKEQSYAVVFELDCPKDFVTYRDTTYMIMTDVFSKEDNTDISVYPDQTLANYPGLSNYYNDRGQRVVWASSAKSFAASHYRERRAPTTPEAILQNHALRYRFHDQAGKRWLSSRLNRSDISHLTTFQLPNDGPYSSLQYALDGTSHTSNHVIANQGDCSQELLLAEYDSFCTLRAGHRLQWLNIAREIVTRTLTFNKTEVWLLVMQAVWEVGPASDGSDSLTAAVYREAHVQLADPAFCEDILATMKEMLISIKANWCEGISARILIMLCLKVLSLTEHSKVQREALLLLRNLRQVTFDWTQKLLKHNQDTSDKTTQVLALEMAITTRMTFNVDPSHFHSVLDSDEDVVILLHCLVIIHENTPPDVSKLSVTTRILLDLDFLLAHAIQPTIHRILSSTTISLDQAIKEAWPAYTGYHGKHRRVHWVIPGLGDSPVLCRTLQPRDAGGNNIHVQYNLLSGELLINGAPFGRLPPSYTSHPTYARIFGQALLDVSPADMGGMSYQLKQPIQDNDVFFTLRNDELIIRLQTPDRQVFELLPHTIFKHDFPIPLVEDFTHFINLRSGILEFRPLKAIWAPSHENWTINCLDRSVHWTMQRMVGGVLSQMIDYRSRTTSMVAHVLGPLEDRKNLEIVYWPDLSHRSGTLTIQLQRFSLDFKVNEATQLECTSLPGLIVDESQDIGTLIGLRNILVLREKGSDAVYGRHVLIPRGEITYERGDPYRHDKSHIVVKIHTGNNRAAAYHKYKVDAILGRLVGSTTLVSRLYQNYLHAVTSYCLPDPLTGLTGTETALENLRRANMWSFQKLSVSEIELLRKIAKLTPARVWYPDYLQVMQTVYWDKHLHPTAQHSEFYTIVSSIIAHWNRISFFYPDEGNQLKLEIPGQAVSAHHLLERAAIRNSVWYAEGDGCSINGNDVVYVPYVERVKSEESALEAKSSHIAGLVFNWSRELNYCRNILDQFKAWGRIMGPNAEDVSLGYSTKLHSLELRDTWLCFRKKLSQASTTRKFSVAFCLGTLAYEGIPIEHLETLLAFATLPGLARVTPQLPEHHTSYSLTDGFEYSGGFVRKEIEGCRVSFYSSPERQLSVPYGVPAVYAEERQRYAYQTRVDSQVKEIVEQISNYHALERLPVLRTSHLDLLDIKSATLNTINQQLASWYRNRQLRDYVNTVQHFLARHCSSRSSFITASKYQHLVTPAKHHSNTSCVHLRQLLQRDSPQVYLTPPPILPTFSPLLLSTSQQLPLAESHKGRPEEVYCLRNLITEFEKDASSGFERKYTADMYTSWRALNDQAQEPIPLHFPYTETEILGYQNLWGNYVHEIEAKLFNYLVPSAGADHAMYTSGLWPHLTPRSILSLLCLRIGPTATTTPDLDPGWKGLFTAYSLAIIGLQRAQRLLHHIRNNDVIEFMKDLKNPGCQGWDAETYPEWLLFQIENALIIRPVQVAIAKEMIAPSNRENAVMQLNMGEGKSSVIVPAIAAALANGEKLVRVIVLKPLAGQMFRLLVGKLAGLVNRRIYYLPFSRGVAMKDVQTAVQIQQLYQECMNVGGILLVQPEHLLSFKLMGIEKIGEGGSSVIAKELIRSYMWLEKHARDILDESDEILSVKYQLLYTIGIQTAFDGSPERWVAAQEVLALIRRHALEINDQYPEGLQVDMGKSGEFPLTRILHNEVENRLFELVSTTIRDEGLPSISLVFFPIHQRNLAFKFISRREFSAKEYAELVEGCTSKDMTILHLLRGLIANGILSFSLRQKRYRVDYGLALERSKLAVPFRAKDCPAPRAEFGHPDVTIILTCLTYYYRGLEASELEICFNHLYKRDSPELEYERWVKEAFDSVDETLQQLSGVNLLDKHQFMEHVLPQFRLNKATIDFYLSTVVFPNEAKEFPHKLCTSGWDIAEERHYPTTGFSGTNENRYILPLSIKQHDSEGQLHTNATVLSYLLKLENQSYECPRTSSGSRLPIEDVLQSLVERDIQVLIDVGAQILELSNLEVAKLWLGLAKERENPRRVWDAVIFFDEHDELMVLSNGRTEPLEISPFAMNIKQCLIYLDEAHTRGTDLKLPTDSKAAVALGPGLTKDRLVQACMRMRKLGHGQSVIFIAPAEVDSQIRELASSSSDQEPTSIDVIRWVMKQTCAQTQHSLALWADQGSTYQIHQSDWERFRDSGLGDLSQLKQRLQQRESQTLQELYGVPRAESSLLPLSAPIPSDIPVTRRQKIEEIRRICRKFEIASLQSVRAQEEQEREVAHEIERETQRERPSKRTRAEHILEPEVLDIVQYGRKPSPNSLVLFPAFHMFQKTSFGHLLELQPWSGNLYATRDFSTVIATKKSEKVDDYTRPVYWILFERKYGSFIVLSPYEANELLPEIRTSSTCSLHVYAPKIRLAMKPLDNLLYCSTPRLDAKSKSMLLYWTKPLQQLNLFAGQLYFKDYEAYVAVCNFLGIYVQQEVHKPGVIHHGSDGFVHDQASRDRLLMTCRFKKSPVEFLTRLISMRRKHLSWKGTHMGDLVTPRVLRPVDFDDELVSGMGNIRLDDS